MRRAPALLLLLPLVPLAGAHAVPADFAVAPFSEPLPFEGETRTLVSFGYRCGGMSTQATEENMTVRFFVASTPAWARLRVEPETLPLDACIGVGQARATLVGRAERGEGALDAGEVELVARWATSGLELDSTARVPVEAPWVPSFRVEATELAKTVKPQQAVAFPLTLVNLASGLTKLSFEIVTKEGDMQAVVPNPVVLQGRGAPQDRAHVPFTLQSPYRNGAVDEVGYVTLRVTPSAPLDPTQHGEPQEITFTLRTEGLYVPAPPLALVAALVVAALLARRAL